MIAYGKPQILSSVGSSIQVEFWWLAPMIFLSSYMGWRKWLRVILMFLFSSELCINFRWNSYNPDPSKAVQDLLSAQDELFKAGARNFLFIDVPPIHRSPAGKESPHKPLHLPNTTSLSYLVPKQNELVLSMRFIGWNSALRVGIQQFCHTHPEVSVFLFSSYRLFESILDMPEVYEFNNEHVRKNGGSVWMDTLHPTSKVHDHVASNLAEFLQEVAPLPVCQWGCVTAPQSLIIVFGDVFSKMVAMDG